MKCVLIFDQLNDILYSKYDRKFARHIKKVGYEQGLIADGKHEEELNPNVLIQIFSPIVTSQRIMGCQFGNSYSSVQCEDGTNMVFDEYVGYLFILVGTDNVTALQRTLGVCVTIVKHLCGPDVSVLKSNRGQASLVSRLLDTWSQLQDSDQAVLVEAVEQLMVNADLSSATLRALQEAADKLKAHNDFTRVHAMVLVDNKFLSLYSSRSAQDLCPADILFLSLLCEAYHLLPADTSIVDSTESESSEEFYSPQASPQGSPAPRRHELAQCSPLALTTEQPQDGINSQLVLLMGSGAAYNPHVVHMSALEDGVFLLLMVETGNVALSAGLHDAFHALNVIQNVQLQKEAEGVRLAFECLDVSMKRILDGQKKGRGPRVDADGCLLRRLQTRWDFVRRKYVEYLKTGELDCIVRVESSTAGLVEVLKELLQAACWDMSATLQGRDTVQAVVALVRHRLSDFSNFLRVKALRNFTMGSDSLTINKYLEEFPGLVHFLYVDRTHHRVTAPSLDFSSEETLSLTKKKIWSMVEYSRRHLRDGRTAVMWKDTTFNYAYFLWFEDPAGSPVKAKPFPSLMLQSFPMPGILCGDFYQKLVEASFPKTNPSKVRCYELYCIHLGLATASCVLEHSRRLAATVWEVTGLPSNPMDIL